MVNLDRIDQIIDLHNADTENLIAILLDCQSEFSHLPEELLKKVSDRVDVPMSEVLSIATFFRAFSLEPVGRFPIHVCMGTACYVLGAPKLVDAFCRELGIKENERTRDGLFSLHTINCPGCCGLAPVVMVGSEIIGKVNQVQVPKIIARYRKLAEQPSVETEEV